MRKKINFILPKTAFVFGHFKKKKKYHFRDPRKCLGNTDLYVSVCGFSVIQDCENGTDYIMETSLVKLNPSQICVECLGPLSIKN
jgi:hypothetical protein